MRIFVDTNIWINYFSGRNTLKTQRLTELIESGQAIYVLPVIIQEILQGFRYDKDIAPCIDKLETLDVLPFEFQDAVEAAKLYRILRKKGITPTTIDLQIVTICRRHKLHLLTEDIDFLAIGKNVDLLLI